MKPTRTGPALTLLLGLVVVLGTACTASRVSGTAIAGDVTHPLGAGLIWRGPGDATAAPFPDQLTDGGSCDLLEASVSEGGDRVLLILPDRRCVSRYRTHPPINGFHGEYLTPPPGATTVGRTTVPAGALITFDQLYSEYTNSRNDFNDRIGLITLTAPPDPDHPVLQLVVTYRDGAADADAQNRLLLDVAAGVGTT